MFLNKYLDFFQTGRGYDATCVNGRGGPRSIIHHFGT